MKNINLLKNIKVLLVEDEHSLATLLQNGIGDYFKEFYIASNGKDGIEKYYKYLPDLIITDIMMPDLTGLEMIRKLKKNNPNLLAIILSAFSDKDKLLDAIDIGVMKYFIKPFDPDELLNYIVSVSNKIKSDIFLLNDNFEFHISTEKLYKDKEYISITKREILFLQLLIKKNSYIIHEDEIKKYLWPNEDVSSERLRTFIRRFRSKTSKHIIQNIKALGYQVIPR